MLSWESRVECGSHPIVEGRAIHVELVFGFQIYSETRPYDLETIVASYISWISRSVHGRLEPPCMSKPEVGTMYR